MGASFFKGDKDWLKVALRQGKFTEVEIAMMESTFDAHTNEDIQAINALAKEEKYLRRVCIYKLLSFPTEVTAILVTLGLKHAIEHKDLTKLYLRYLLKKITLVEFQNSLMEFGKTGKVK